MTIWHALLHWLAVHTGTVNEPGPYYGFFSGFGSDLSELALLGGIVAMVRHRNCEVKRCWRLSRHRTAAGHRVCRRHMPGGAPTHDDVLADHAAALTAQEPPDQPADLAALLAEVRGLRADVSGMSETVRGVLLADRQGGHRGH